MGVSTACKSRGCDLKGGGDGEGKGELHSCRFYFFLPAKIEFHGDRRLQ